MQESSPDTATALTIRAYEPLMIHKSIALILFAASLAIGTLSVSSRNERLMWHAVVPGLESVTVWMSDGRTFLLASTFKLPRLCGAFFTFHGIEQETPNFCWRYFSRGSKPRRVAIAFATVPAWALVVVLALYPAGLIGRYAVRRTWRWWQNLCANCGYNLTGSISGVCPECGKIVRQSGAFAQSAGYKPVPHKNQLFTTTTLNSRSPNPPS